MPEPPEPDSKPPFILERKRLGRIRQIDPIKKFGFIEAEDYREDVFFHLAQWESRSPRDAGPRMGQVVEFIVDELHRRESGRLRATLVRATNRPLEFKLTGKSNPELMVKHHPRARQRKPTWRRNDSEE